MSNEVEKKISQLSNYWGIPKKELIELIKLANKPNYILEKILKEVNEKN